MTESELREFFDRYGASFTQTAADVAEFYQAPSMTARQGQVRLNATREDVTAFFDAVLQQYRAQGVTQGDMLHFAWTPLGVRAIAATITWSYKDSTDQTRWEWTFTYNLYHGADGWKILVQTLHDAA